jgi:hypothetical protein
MRVLQAKALLGRDLVYPDIIRLSKPVGLGTHRLTQAVGAILAAQEKVMLSGI